MRRTRGRLDQTEKMFLSEVLADRTFLFENFGPITGIRRETCAIKEIFGAGPSQPASRVYGYNRLDVVLDLEDGSKVWVEAKPSGVPACIGEAATQLSYYWWVVNHLAQAVPIQFPQVRAVILVPEATPLVMSWAQDTFPQMKVICHKA